MEITFYKMCQLSNLFGTPGYSEWVRAQESWESCPIATPSKRCLGKRYLWLKQTWCFRQPVLLSTKNLIFMTTSFLVITVFSRSCRIHDSSKTGVSIAEFKGAVSGRKKATCFNLVSLLICTTFSCEILNSLKNEIKKIV